MVLSSWVLGVYIVCFFAYVFPVCVANPVIKNEKHLYILHYHKTGYAVTVHVLCIALTGVLPDAFALHRHVSPVIQNTTIMLDYPTAPYLAELRETGKWTPPVGSKFIHMIRPPLGWIKSHYLYHKAGNEMTYSSRLGGNICSVDGEVLKLFAAAGIDKSFAYRLQAECATLIKGKTYYRVLLHDSVTVGMRLTAMSFFLGTQHDARTGAQCLLRAVDNLRVINQYEHTTVLTPDIHDATLPSTVGVMRNISNLIYSGDEASAKRMTGKLLHQYAEYSATSSSKHHVTAVYRTDNNHREQKAFSDDPTMAAAIEDLRAHKLLGPMFQKVANAFEKYTGRSMIET